MMLLISAAAAFRLPKVVHGYLVTSTGNFVQLIADSHK